MSDTPRRYPGFAAPTSQALQYYAVFLVLLAICLALSLISNVFTTIENLGNVSEQVSVVGVTAMGMTLLLVSGNIDLSVGGQVALIGVVVAVVTNSVNTPAGVVAGILVGLLLGVVNGLIVTRLAVNSLVATLGSGLAFGGLALPAVRIAADRADRPQPSGAHESASDPSSGAGLPVRRGGRSDGVVSAYDRRRA